MDTKELTSALTALGWVRGEIDAYIRYVKKIKQHNALVSIGKLTINDSQTERVYSAEYKFEQEFDVGVFENEQSIQKFTKKVLESDTWKQIQFNNLFAEYSIKTPKIRVVCKKTPKGIVAHAYHDGLIVLNTTPEGMNKFTLLHELAHQAGYMHHDWGFVHAFVVLVEEFMGKKEGQRFKEILTGRKVKFSAKRKTPKFPTEWIGYYRRANHARNFLK